MGTDKSASQFSMQRPVTSITHGQRNVARNNNCQEKETKKTFFAKVTFCGRKKNMKQMTVAKNKNGKQLGFLEDLRRIKRLCNDAGRRFESQCWSERTSICSSVISMLMNDEPSSFKVDVHIALYKNYKLSSLDKMYLTNFV